MQIKSLILIYLLGVNELVFKKLPTHYPHVKNGGIKRRGWKKNKRQ